MSPRDTPPELLTTTRPRPAIWLLVAIIGLGPFTMQVVVPSLPGIAREFGTGSAGAQLTITLYLVSVTFGQLIYGPLSDRFGRRPLLMGGLAVHMLGSLACVLALSIEMLVVARVVQALGACAGVVLARAVIRDAWPRDEAAAVLGYVTMGMTIAPMVAPVLGSLLEEAWSWRGGMLACLLFALPVALASWKRLPETLPEPQPLPGLVAILRAFGSLWAIPAFRAYAAVTACSTGIFFAFLGGAPHVVVEGMGHSPVTFGVAFAVMSVLFAAGGWISGRLSPRLGTLRMLEYATVLTTGGALLALLLALLLPPHIMLFCGAMSVVALGNGMTQPNAIAAALSVRPQLAGTASSLIGALQMGLGAALTFFVSLVEGGIGIGTTLTMSLVGIAGFLALRAARRG